MTVELNHKRYFDLPDAVFKNDRFALMLVAFCKDASAHFLHEPKSV